MRAGGLSTMNLERVSAAADVSYGLRDEVVDALDLLQSALTSPDREVLARAARTILRGPLRRMAGETVIATRLVEVSLRPPTVARRNEADDDAAPPGGAGSGLTPSVDAPADVVTLAPPSRPRRAPTREIDPPRKVAAGR